MKLDDQDTIIANMGSPAGSHIFSKSNSTFSPKTERSHSAVQCYKSWKPNTLEYKSSKTTKVSNDKNGKQKKNKFK